MHPFISIRGLIYRSRKQKGDFYCNGQNQCENEMSSFTNCNLHIKIIIFKIITLGFLAVKFDLVYSDSCIRHSIVRQ